MIISGLITFLLMLSFVCFSADYDGSLIERKKYIKSHVSRWFFRCAIFCLTGFIELQFILASAFLFTALFDQVINYRLNNPTFYLGTVANWDKFFRKRTILYISIKVLALIISLTLFFVKIPYIK
jgi:hypothetical protein